MEEGENNTNMSDSIIFCGNTAFNSDSTDIEEEFSTCMENMEKDTPTHMETNLRHSSENDDYDHIVESEDELVATEKGAKLDMDVFDDIQEKNVSSLPYDIDGTQVFTIKCSRDEIMKRSKDGRPWKVWVTSKRKQFKGIRRRANCKGSHVCNQQDCPYFQDCKRKNRVQFQSVGGVVHCFCCGCPAVSVKCNAQKVWEYANKNRLLKVYHFGKHTCEPKKCPSNTEIMKESILKHATLGPAKIANRQILEAIERNDDWKDVEEIADSLTDAKKIRNMKRMEVDAIGHSFDAVGKLKEKCDEKDEFLIYRINNKNHNNEPSYVFKTSKIMAEVGIKIDKTNDHPLSNEFCFFTGNMTAAKVTKP